MNEDPTHELKTWPTYFRISKEGHKHFEVRRYDRDFRPGQVILLREWDPSKEEYTGRELERRISWLLTGGKLGIEEGYCILALHPPDGIYYILEKVRRKIYEIQEGAMRKLVNYEGKQIVKDIEKAFADNLAVLDEEGE